MAADHFRGEFFGFDEGSDSFPEMSPLLVCGPKGGLPRRSNFQKHWDRARLAAGLGELHLHDLRHTGNTLAAEDGASLRDLMDRMGHSTTRAARIYLHKSAGRDEAMARRMSERISRLRQARKSIATPKSHTGGTQGARL